MGENNLDLMELTKGAENALGGTELAMRRIFDGKIPRGLLEQFQIIPTRVRDLKEDKYRILYVHDLPEDPEVQVLVYGGWKRFHRIVFVSNWQAQRFIEKFAIPWSKTAVLLNAIDPVPVLDRPKDQINIVYHTTPHRGLSILLPVFDRLSKTYDNIHLDLYSSFKLYGWAERDKQFENLFRFADGHPKITNHGAVPQGEVRAALGRAHIFAYPSIWCETSCCCLMEAMSAGLVCVHSNLGALFETAANWTNMYHVHEESQEHAKLFHAALENAIQTVHEDATKSRCQSQKVYADAFYNWEIRARQWEAFLSSVAKPQ
jgi:UDP-glucose:(glucosyl)LPS alpha-1,2-glucosyltransferase